MKNYYNILGLETPSLSPSSTSPPRQLDPQYLRRAYKSALLIAHPDKSSATANASSNTTSSPTYTYTIDDVKEAYMVLSDAGRRAEYNRLLLAQNRSGIGNDNEEEGERDFILGLEVLDLGDFVEGVSQSSTSSTSASSSSSCDSAVSGEAEGKIEWYRPCRCGAEKGFRIEEDELENAERRGEKEVLVGCEGCSLWVRVGFDVEVEEG